MKYASIEHEVARLEIAARREVAERLNERTYAEYEQISKILQSDTARTIFEQAMGERFHRIYAQRDKLWLKLEVYRKMLDWTWDEIARARREQKELNMMITR